MKVIFVGIHNKPGKMPLCSSTVSGKIIDRVIQESGIKEWRKVNLCNRDYLPRDKEIEECIVEFLNSDVYNIGDTFVLLGQIVHDHFPTIHGVSIVKLAHPASSIFGRQKREIYIQNAVSKLQSI